MNLKEVEQKDQLYSLLIKNNKETNIFDKYITDYNILLTKYLQLASEYEKKKIIETCFGEQNKEKYSQIEMLISFFKSSLIAKQLTVSEKDNLLNRELMNIVHIFDLENKRLSLYNEKLKLTISNHIKSIKLFEEMCFNQEKEIFELQGWNNGLKQENQLIKDVLNKKK